MELNDAVQGRWRVAVVAIPVAAALLAAVVNVQSAETSYEVSAVFSISEFSSETTPAGLQAATDDFDSALSSREVIDTIRSAAPDSVGRIEAEKVGNGGDIEVVFVSPDPDEGEQALDAGVRTALIQLSEIERRQVSRRVTAADAQAGESLEILLEIEEAVGAADLDNEAQRRGADILSLRNQIASSVNEPLVELSLQRTLDEKTAELELIEDQLLVWNNEKARYDLGVASGADAALRLRQIATNQTDLRDGQLLQSPRVTETSAVTDGVRAAVTAAVVAVILIVGISLLFARRRENDAVDDTGDDGLTEVDDDDTGPEGHADIDSIAPRGDESSVK